MKNSFGNFKKYLLLLIILIPTLIFAIFFSNYYSIYKTITNPPVHNPNTDAIIKNPFEGIEAIEENEENREYMQKDENLTDRKPDFLNETTSNIKSNFLDNTEKPSYNYIVGIYKSKFEKLQHEQENKLYSLMDEAIEEYIKNGSKRTALLGMAPKYINLANSMERQTNREVDMLIDNLKTELTNNSYETGIIKEIRDYYNYYKKIFKAEIIKEGAKHL